MNNYNYPHRIIVYGPFGCGTNVIEILANPKTASDELERMAEEVWKSMGYNIDNFSFEAMKEKEE